MRATRCNLSPIFSLSTIDPWPVVEGEILSMDPWGEATDEAGTVTRVWRHPGPVVLPLPGRSPTPSC